MRIGGRIGKLIYRDFFVTALFLQVPSLAHASFIETTMGTAIVNDATASYYNPAALVLLKNPQAITQGTIAAFRTQFTGRATPVATGIAESGNSSATTNYFSPTFYFGLPINEKIVLGLAAVANTANRDADDSGLLRYVQSSNNIQDYDLAPAIAMRINPFFSIGAGVNISYGNFDLKPIRGFPGTNIPDGQSDNQSSGQGVGANAGFLVRFNQKTMLGFNYRSRTTYNLSGTSVYQGNPRVVSNNYHFKLWSPPRSVVSIGHLLTQQWSIVTTIQRIQWSAFTNINVYGIANVIGTTPIIFDAKVPYYLHDTWLVTLGSQYRINPKWLLRVAGSYNQSPGNPNYQITNGDSFIVGASMAYEFNKTFTLDGSYAHAFIKGENININGTRYAINGVNHASRDAISLKLTFNV